METVPQEGAESRPGSGCNYARSFLCFVSSGNKWVVDGEGSSAGLSQEAGIV
jgi:hypothetical protein